MSFVLISKEEVDAGIDFRRSSMPPTWTQVSTVWSLPSCNPLVGSFPAMGTASSSGSPNVPESTFSKIWVSFLLDSWVGRDLQELKLVKVGLDMPPSNQSRYLSYAELPPTPFTVLATWCYKARCKNSDFEKWHLSVATPTNMCETNNQPMSHSKIHSAQAFTYQGSQRIAPTNPNRTSNVKTCSQRTRFGQSAHCGNVVPK